MEYFIDDSRAHMIVDQLQYEQSDFLEKRNRNMIVEVDVDEIDLPDNFCWLTLWQLKELLKIDNLVNMDARSVLACIPFHDMLGQLMSSDLVESLSIDVLGYQLHGYSKDLLLSSLCSEKQSLHTSSKVVSWVTEMRVQNESCVELISLQDLGEWNIGEKEIVHEEGKHFSILPVHVESELGRY